MSNRLAVLGCIAALSLAAVGCGDDGYDASNTHPIATPGPASVADQLAATGIGGYLGVMPSSMKMNGEWEEFKYDPAQGGPICLRGTPYQVNLRRGTSNNVLLYLEGGGACWDYATCWQSPLAKLAAGAATSGGVLDNTNAANPFRDWTIVYASYCDGSVFAGDNIATYGGKQTYHHGLYNLSAAVSLVQREIPAPDRIVVSGSSAGGFGTYTGYGVTRVAFPHTPILVLDDSGPGLQNPAETQAIADRAANWKFMQYVPATCTQCATQLTFLSGWALDRDPTLRVAYFDYQQDGVLEFFLNLSPDGFQSLLRSVTGDLRLGHEGRFKRFFPQGQTHTVLADDSFYSVAIGATAVRDWTADFLSNGPAWQDLVEQ